MVSLDHSPTGVEQKLPAEHCPLGLGGFRKASWRRENFHLFLSLKHPKKPAVSSCRTKTVRNPMFFRGFLKFECLVRITLNNILDEIM